MSFLDMFGDIMYNGSTRVSKTLGGGSIPSILREYSIVAVQRSHQLRAAVRFRLLSYIVNNHGSIIDDSETYS